ncbi:MAG: Cell division protein FtsZ [Ignavibacteria bacterium]|nr:Cell division protein FtsZ [Ignavibacteria bacterium]
MPIELDTTSFEGAKIRVIGVGGGGGNAVNTMIEKGLSNVDFIAVNTDKQALAQNKAKVCIQLGKDITRGLGAGARPDIGKKAAEESQDEIRDTLKGSDMVFVTCGMGGGTGTGGSPVVARIARELGALVVGIVTKPFKREGKPRRELAQAGILELREWVDALIIIPNQKLLDITDQDTDFETAFKKVDDVLYNATRGIADIISKHGKINVDFADVRTIMTGMGDALMSIGSATGDHRAIEATQNALNSPLLDGISISGARGVLVNFSGKKIAMREIDDALALIEEEAGEEANIIFGIATNEELEDELMITVVATGFTKKDEDSLFPQQPVKEEPKSYKNHSPRLPMQFDNMPGVKPPSYAVPFGHGSKSNTVINTGSEFQKNTFSFNSKPQSNTELKELDVPTAIRLGAPDGINNGTTEQGTIAPGKDKIISTIDKKNEAMLDKPAFLRRIMD